MSYLGMGLLTVQLFKNGNDTQGKLRLNFNSLNVSLLLEYAIVAGVQLLSKSLNTLLQKSCSALL